VLGFLRKIRKSRGRLREKRKRRLFYSACALVLASICLATYVFWPRSESNLFRGGAVIVDSFYSSDPQFTDGATELLKSVGTNVDLYKDENVTVDLYRKLPEFGYSLIVLRVHAGILGRDPTAPTFLFTNEEFGGKYLLEQMSDQILSGVINPDDPTEKPLYTVGPLFVKISMEGNFRDSVIILSSCLGLYTNELAEEFIHKGAKAFISWNGKVDLSHTDEACTLLLKILTEERLTIGEAVEKVMTQIGQDPTYGSELKYYPQEASNLKLEL
jgi:hypothetical protein